MTRQELDEIIRTLPGVHTRWGIALDLPAVLAIERKTGGFWDESRFCGELRRRDDTGEPCTVLYVAVCNSTERIRGFAVCECSTEDGTRYLTVLDLAALDPAARHTLIGDLGQRALRFGRTLIWATAAY